MTWLINSMIPTIGKTFLLYPSTAEIWNAARETYSSTNNIVELYRIKDQATALKQDSMPITLYYNTLTAYWQQLDLYENHDWADPKDTAQYQKIKTQRRVFQFLQGLNNNLDDVRGRVLATSPLPSIREAFATVKKEASRRSVMLSEDSIGTSEGSTLLTNLSSSSTRKGRPWCEYCKKSGHTKDKCWKLHGKPLDWKSKANRDDKPFPTLANTVTSFTKEQLADLQKLFENFQGPYESNLVLASPEGNTHQDFFSSQMNTEWILDSGAIDHMTGNKALFTSFFPYYGKTVKTADESLCNIAGRGSVFLNAQLSLHNVLFVPSLACNLISVSKLSQDLNCSVVFDVSQYTVQALNPTKMIGKARLQNELYTLPSIPQTNISSSFTALGKFDNIMLWHFRYSSLRKDYKCYHPPSKRIFITMDVTFFEHDPYFHLTATQGETLHIPQVSEYILPPHSSPLLPSFPAASPKNTTSSTSPTSHENSNWPAVPSPKTFPETTFDNLDTPTPGPPPTTKQIPMQVYTRKRKKIPQEIL
ncbi:hypothetical protein V6N13_075176 [Hibiscus sabdariffa]